MTAHKNYGIRERSVFFWKICWKYYDSADDFVNNNVRLKQLINMSNVQ